MTNPATCIEETLVPHTAYAKALTLLDQAYRYAGTPEPTCVAVIGESRTGKSRLIEEFTANHPPMRTDAGRDNPILSVRVPAKPTVKGLVELLLNAAGDPAYSKGTVNEKTLRLETLLQNAKTNAVVLDEFQHFQDKGTLKIMHEVSDWLKILVDRTRIVLVVAGLPSCQTVISQNAQLAGRFHSPVRMPRFDWMQPNDRDEFIGILGAFHMSLCEHFDVPDFSEEELAYRFYCGTGGLIGYVSKLLRLAVRNAMDANSHTITFQGLACAHAESVWDKEAHPGITNPFDLSLSLVPTQELSINAQKIGTAISPTPNARVHSPTPARLRVGQTLAAR